MSPCGKFTDPFLKDCIYPYCTPETTEFKASEHAF